MLPLHFHGGRWGKKGHCFVSLVSVFSVTHSSLQKTNSPNESGRAVAAPSVSHSAPASSPEPFAGSVLKGLGSRTRPLFLAVPTITPSWSSSLGTVHGGSVQTLSSLAAARLGFLHPPTVFTPHQGVEK